MPGVDSYPVAGVRIGAAEDAAECEVVDDLEDVVDFVLFFVLFPVVALWCVVVAVEAVDSTAVDGAGGGVGDWPTAAVAAARAAVMRNL